MAENEMTLEQVEAELLRRQDTDSTDNHLLTIGMELFRQNPSKMIAESPSFVNKLLEVENRRLELEALKKPVSKIPSEMSTLELEASIMEAITNYNRVYEAALKIAPHIKAALDAELKIR